MNLPLSSTTARIAPMAVLPVFFKLQNKRVVLAGGSLGAAWKVELLVACGAYVDVYTTEPEAEMISIAAEHPTRVQLHHRPWSYDVMQGAAMAIGGIEQDEEGQAFRCAACCGQAHSQAVRANRVCRVG